LAKISVKISVRRVSSLVTRLRQSRGGKRRLAWISVAGGWLGAEFLARPQTEAQRHGDAVLDLHQETGAAKRFQVRFRAAECSGE
jgi:hypothetical protein